MPPSTTRWPRSSRAGRGATPRPGCTGAWPTLAVTWPSDQGLIDAYAALLRGARLGHEGITYRPVRAAEANRAPRLVGAPVAAALRLRVLHREDGLVTITPQKQLAQA